MNSKTQYDAIAELYHRKRQRPEDSLWNNQIDLPMILKLLPELADLQILDLGCGSGLLSRKLKDLGAQSVIGVDPSQKLLQIGEDENPDIQFQLGSASQIPLQNASQDGVVSALVLHYLSNIRPFFDECARVLKPSGFLIFTFHHPIMEVIQLVGEQMVLKPNYFEEKIYEWQMSQSEKLLSFHHTFETILNSLVQAGFVFETLLEGRAPDTFRKSHPEFFQRAGLYPSFAGIRARRSAQAP